MTEQEKTDWNLLYNYVKKQIMNYDDKLLTKNMILRLKGLKTGKQYANSKTENRASYSYEVILRTFQDYREVIKKTVLKKEFKTDNQKFNYICAIIENYLNDSHRKVKEEKSNEEWFDRLKPVSSNKEWNYKKKTKEAPAKYDKYW